MLSSQVVYSNKAGLSHFVGGTGCTLFGTAVATQVVQYLSHVGQRQLPVFNGLYDGKMGSSMRGTQRVQLHPRMMHITAYLLTFSLLRLILMCCVVLRLCTQFMFTMSALAHLQTLSA